MKKRTSKGYTLIELAVGLVILGVLTVVLWRFGFSVSQGISRIEAPQTLVAADQALVGFVAAHGRLPCPDTVGDGAEHCGAVTIGQLPVVALGLARADVLQVRYGVFRRPQVSPATDTDLAAQPLDRFFPWLAVIPNTAGVSPVALNQPLGATNGLDFCQALRLGGALPTGALTDTTVLNIRASNAILANSAPIRNVAYALSLPDAGTDPANNLNTLANAFASPTQPSSAAYHDTVLAVDFAQLFDRLSCGPILATAGHAHPNAASAAAIMRGAILDYKVQLDLQEKMNEVSVLSAGAGVAGSTAAVAMGTAAMATATANALYTLGTMAPGMVLAGVGVGLSAATVAVNIAALAVANENWSTSKQLVAEFSPLKVTASATLATAVRANAIAADAAGLN
jgi:prepilin-type N-terminal cleavage/methylation domain-containing protein